MILKNAVTVEIPNTGLGLRSVRLKLLDIQPATGSLEIYGAPYGKLIVRMDANAAEMDVPTTEPMVYIVALPGTRTFRVRLISFDDAEGGGEWVGPRLH